MQWRFYKSAMFACVALGQAAQACNEDMLDPEDVHYADVVVVGRIKNYRLIANQGYDESVGKRFNPPDGNLPPPLISGILPGRFYGRFDVVVGKVIKGKVGRRFSATLRPYIPCCHGPDTKEELPKQVQSRSYLIAFDKPRDTKPFGKSKDAALPTVRINICVGAFMMKMPDAAWFEQMMEQSLAKQRGKLPKR